MKAKRTYNLSVETISTVKALVERDGAAPSQDALVERAVRAYARHLRDLDHQRRWGEAAADPAFQAEQEAFFAEFAEDDRQAFED